VFKFPGGDLAVTEVRELKGESSVSIRKGKKIVSFDYKVSLAWDAVLRDGDGKEVAKLKGVFELPEISSDEDDWEVNTSFKEDPGKIQGRVEKIVKKDAVEALNKEIKEKFVKELKEK